jgi:molybdenum cofactor biosynthesis protein B
MPGQIDQNRPFLPVNIAILTVSDTRDASQDRSGDTLADLVTSAGAPDRGAQDLRDKQEMSAG